MDLLRTSSPFLIAAGAGVIGGLSSWWLEDEAVSLLNRNRVVIPVVSGFAVGGATLFVLIYK